MKKHIVTLLTLTVCAGIIIGCSPDVSTDALQVGFSQMEVNVTEKKDNDFTSATKFTTIITNRTERVMNIVFSEATIVDAKTGEALVRFRPIVPESYGSTSTVQLFSKQTQEFPVVSPVDLYGFNPVQHPEVMIKVFFQTQGYRTEAVSGPVPVRRSK